MTAVDGRYRDYYSTVQYPYVNVTLHRIVKTSSVAGPFRSGHNCLCVHQRRAGCVCDFARHGNSTLRVLSSCIVCHFGRTLTLACNERVHCALSAPVEGRIRFAIDIRAALVDDEA